MGVHERQCIDVPFIEKELEIKNIDLKNRNDIFLKIYLLKTKNWEVLKDWISFLSEKGKKTDRSWKTEKKRLLDIYKSIKEKGYIYPILDKRDRPITVIQMPNKFFYNLNGADRIASLILCEVNKIKVRQIKKSDFCCHRVIQISHKFNLEKGRFMEGINKDVKLWISNFKKEINA